MKPETLANLIVVGSLLLFFVMVVAIVVFQRWRRKTRWPFKAEDKLIRGPGEELKRRIAAIDERLLSELIAGACLGLLCLGFVGDDLRRWLGLAVLPALIGAFFGMAVVYAASGWRISRLLSERRNYYLGWFGERYVAEWLEPVKLAGGRVFHDLPALSNGAGFNLDHVVVGPGGVVVIETKTRRKGNALPGRKDSTVVFDGHKLEWPWGADTHGLEQAERNALWLAEWIKGETGERVFVAPMLVLPGWWLELKPAKDGRLCRVVNPKWLPGHFAKQPPVLTPAQVDLIALRLEARCRDVED